jgi:hypothetical protein
MKELTARLFHKYLDPTFNNQRTEQEEYASTARVGSMEKRKNTRIPPKKIFSGLERGYRLEKT